MASISANQTSLLTDIVKKMAVSNEHEELIFDAVVGFNPILNSSQALKNQEDLSAFLDIISNVVFSIDDSLKTIAGVIPKLGENLGEASPETLILAASSERLHQGFGNLRMFLQNTLTPMKETLTNLSETLIGNKLLDEENRREMLKQLGLIANGREARPVPPRADPPREEASSPIWSILGLAGLYKSLTTFSKMFGAVSGFFPKLIKFIEAIPVIGKPFIAKLAPMFRFFSKLGGFLTKFGKFIPVVGEVIIVIMGIIDTVKGAIEGYKTGGVLGAIKGGISGLLVGLVGSLLDMIKDGVSWIANAMGFEEFAKLLDGFSFSDIIKDFVDFSVNFYTVIWGFVSGIAQWWWHEVSPIFGKIRDGFMSFFRLIGQINGYINGIFTSLGGLVWEGLKLLGLDTFAQTSIVDPISDFFDTIGIFFSDMFTSAKEYLGTLFAGNAVEDLYKGILIKMLPDPRQHTELGDPLYYVSKAIPKSVYDYAGMDITGPSPQQAIVESVTANKAANDYSSWRRSFMSDAEYTKLSRADKQRYANQFKNKKPELEPLPSTNGSVLAAAGSGQSSAPVIINNMGGNTTNSNVTSVNNSNSYLEAMLTGSAMAFTSN